MRLMGWLATNLSELRTSFLLLLILVYLAVSWVLFALAGEWDLVGNLINFIYFTATTASTVGYGDLSPSTDAGKLVAAVWFFPGALLVFTAVLGKITSALLDGVRRMSEGLNTYEHLVGATVLIGYHPERTETMIRDIVAGDDGDDTIILLTRTRELMLPKNVRIVVSERLDTLEALTRAGVALAEKILIHANSDAETFNACLAVREINRAGHVAAYFSDPHTASRARSFGNVETVLSTVSEMLVRAAQDPGASNVLIQLATATDGATLYSGDLDANAGQIDCGRFSSLVSKFGAAVIAVRRGADQAPEFAPFSETFPPGSSIFYIAEKRLSEAQWQDAVSGAGNV